MSEKTELKPCPFCGSPAHTRLAYASNPGVAYSGRHFWEVMCNNPDCEATSPNTENDTEAEVAAAWNRRPAITALKEEGQSYDDIVQLKYHLTALAAFAKEVIDDKGLDVVGAALRHGLVTMGDADCWTTKPSDWLSRIQKEEGQATRADDGATAPSETGNWLPCPNCGDTDVMERAGQVNCWPCGLRWPASLWNYRPETENNDAT